MPDLDIQYYWRCETVEHFEADVLSSDRSKTYLVTVDSSEKTGEVWDCSCPALKKCWHIGRAAQLRCGWDEFLYGGDPAETDGEKACPRCGGPVTSAGKAV